MSEDAARRRSPPPPAPDDGRGAAQVADDRRRLQGARAGVPGHLDLEDPLPRGPEAARAAAHARRLPALLADRRRAAAHDPAPAARRVPAAAGDPPGARRAAAPRTTTRAAPPAAAPRADARARRRAAAVTFSLRDRGALYSLEEVVEETGADPRLVAELEDFGIVKGERARRRAATTTRPSARSCARSTELARYGVGGPQPARVQDLGRARGGAAAADPRPVAALAQPGAAARGDRDAREPRRGRLAPQAPAARRATCAGSRR